MYKKATIVFIALWALSACVFLYPSLSVEQTVDGEGQEENSVPTPVSPTPKPVENQKGSSYENLVKFLVRNRVDENEYRRLTLREKAELAENLELPVIHAESIEEYENALPSPGALPNYFPEQVVQEHKRRMNGVVVFENETTFKVKYYHDSTLDNAVEERNYVCSDFARDLQKDAVNAGFRCAYAEIFVEELPYGHAIDAFEIDNHLVFVEPQTDRIIGPLSTGGRFEGLTIENIFLRWNIDTSS